MKNFIDDMQISEAARILGLSPQGIRYYEQLGVISPKRNNTNNRREFGTDELAALVCLSFYRKCGIPLDDACKLIKADSFAEIWSILNEQAAIMEREIVRKQQIVGIMREFAETVKELDRPHIDETHYDFYFAQFPALYYLSFHKPKTRTAADKKRQQLVDDWLKQAPLVLHMVRSNINNETGLLEHDLGLGIFIKDCGVWNPLADRKNMPFIQQHPACDCLCATIKIGESEAAFRDAVLFLKKHNKEPLGTAILLSFVSSLSSNDNVSYCQAWFPYKEKED